MANSKYTSIGSASDVGKEFRNPNRYKGLSAYQQRKINEFLYGSGKLAEAGTAGGAAASAVGKQIAKTAAKKTAAPAAKKSTAKKTAPAAPAARAGRGAGPKTAAAKTAAPANKGSVTTSRTRPSRAGLPKGAPSGARPGNAPATRPKAPTARQQARAQSQMDAWRAANPRAAASPKGRLSRADAAIQARMSSVAGRASSTFKRVPGSSQAAGMARTTGAASVKAYNKLPGGNKTKMATAAGIGGVPASVAAGMYANRNKGKPSPSSGKPKNGDTKTLGGRKATYRNGSWYAY